MHPLAAIFLAATSALKRSKEHVVADQASGLFCMVSLLVCGLLLDSTSPSVSLQNVLGGKGKQYHGPRLQMHKICKWHEGREK